MLAIAGGFLVLPYHLIPLIIPLLLALLYMAIEANVREYPHVPTGQPVAFWKKHWLTTRYELTILIGEVGITLSSYAIQHPLVMYCPLVMFGIYKAFNSLMGSPFIKWVSWLFLFVNLFIGISKATSSMDCTVFVVFSVLILCAVNLIQNLTVAGIKEAEDTVGKALTTSSVLGFMAQSVRHDINNKLTLLEGAMWFTLQEKEMDRVHTQVIAISSLLNGLDTTRRSTTDVCELVKSTYKKYYPHTQYESIFIQTHRHQYEIHENFVRSVITNLIENAVEAGKRRKVDPAISVLVGNGYVEVEDHAGGFDITGIREGKSSKTSSGHGKFLAMLTDSSISALFGLVVEVTSLGDGTKFRVTFQEV
jgi:hypothetical protein